MWLKQMRLSEIAEMSAQKKRHSGAVEFPFWEVTLS
jgi:hypothetical protein